MGIGMGMADTVHHLPPIIPPPLLGESSFLQESMCPAPRLIMIGTNQ